MGEGEDDPALLELERRQERILLDLNALKNEVDMLSERYMPSSGSRQITKNFEAASNDDWLKTGVVHDIVINANPNQPPHSLFVLYKLLSEQYTCAVSVHTHSSINVLPYQLLDCFGECSTRRHDAQLMLTLIWKDVPCAEMIVSPNTQTPIQGESNVARYLARLLNPAYDSGDIIQATEIDNWIDLASNSFLNGSSRERTAAIKTLNSHLGKQDWLMGDELSLADVMMWSALHQSGQEAESAPANIQKWFKACGVHPSFDRAQGLL
ncbi:aminoacyl tRNA synthase complex-interacting multifunctional protein 2-like isoform X2 [Anneissia japonica]|uniref:aminoacyl tRNA synthase complex-interacting multifunctional protein 2-like isoform X2 n=1 Tax=Anneissia japonica TaxID=1529436 RepID=UPI001425A463|nr:aminoacyl tRNA synthase complex-interacting multifunctional protein 2-like isoform X2 [Anneissia japonica]